MTLNALEQAKIAAMKAKDKVRKDALNDLIAAVRNTAIEKKCKDNIAEELVDEVISKRVKIYQEMVDTCPADRAETLAEYKAQLAVIKEFAPYIETDPEKINEVITSLLASNENPESKAAAMKIVMPFLKASTNPKYDMKVASQVLNARYN